MKFVLLLFSLFYFIIFCHGRNEPRIWNGVPVPPTKYPNVVRIHQLGINTTNFVPFAPFPHVMLGTCTGSVISPRHILTAGHCVKQRIDVDPVKNLIANAQLDGFIIDFGELDPDYEFKNNLSSHGFATETKDKGFSYADIRKDDIAIIEFPEGYDLKITPVILAKNYVEDGTDIGTNVGFGDIDPDAEKYVTPKTLMEVNLTIWKECAANVGEYHVMCVGNKTHRSDHGDSGGPLFLTRGNKLYQIGAVHGGGRVNGSSANNDAELIYFTRISSYCDWIEEITNSEAKCVDIPPPSESPTPESPEPALPTPDAQKGNDENGSDAILKNAFIILLAVLFANVLNMALFF